MYGVPTDHDVFVFSLGVGFTVVVLLFGALVGRLMG